MITKIYFPVIDTEHGEYKYEGKLTREDYDEMVLQNFLSTNRQMNMFIENMRNGISNMGRLSSKTYQIDEHPEIRYNLCEIEALLLDGDRNDIKPEFFNSHIENEDMFILILNINPDMEPDVSSELKFWIGDSVGIHLDYTLDTATKMEYLPTRSFLIQLYDDFYVMKNCKILQNYGDKRNKFKFAIIVEKILEKNKFNNKETM